MKRTRRIALAGSLALGLSACAEAPPPMAVSAAPPALSSREPSPADVEMLSIARAEESIDRLFPSAGRSPSRTDTSKPSADDKRVPPAADAAPAQPSTSPSPPAPSTPPSGGAGASGDSCSVACRALQAMASSADHLCQLAGENDGRCDDARGRVRGASARVRSSCPSCSVSTGASPIAAPRVQVPAGPPGAAPPAPGMPGSTTPIR